jgi:hypothetical protein
MQPKRVRWEWLKSRRSSHTTSSLSSGVPCFTRVTGNSMLTAEISEQGMELEISFGEDLSIKIIIFKGLL